MRATLSKNRSSGLAPEFDFLIWYENPAWVFLKFIEYVEACAAGD